MVLPQSEKHVSMVQHTNVQNDYADMLQKNGYTYTGADGKTYNSGAYSIVHDKDFVGNKWIPFLLGTNDTTQGTCKGFCYSHSSYFAEVPEQYQRDEDENIKMENLLKQKTGKITQKNGEPLKQGLMVNISIMLFRN